MQDDTIPVLRLIAFDNDTTLEYGGYDFYNTAVNEPIEDSLFEDVTTERITDRKPHRPITRENAHRRMLFSVDGKAQPISQRDVLFDVRGRMHRREALTPGANNAAGVTIRGTSKIRQE